jgi:hypothetical protein
MQRRYGRNVEGRSCNHCCRESNKYYILRVSCLAVVIQHALRMRCIILSSVACLAVPYFSTLSHQRHDYWGGGGKFTGHKIFLLIFSIDFV